MSPSRGRLLAWLAALGAAITALAVLDRGELAGPALAQPDRWLAWFTSGEGASRAMALVRMGLMGWCGYLLVVTLGYLLADVGRLRSLRRLTDLITARWARRLLESTVALSLLSPAPAMAAPAASDPPVMVLVSPTGDGSGPAPSSPPSTTPPSTTTPSTTPPATLPEASTWLVQPGDHLWSIAQRVVAQHRGRPVSDIEIAPYWRDLIEANRSLLVDPDNADLLFPGQTLRLPPV